MQRARERTRCLDSHSKALSTSPVSPAVTGDPHWNVRHVERLLIVLSWSLKFEDKELSGWDSGGRHRELSSGLGCMWGRGEPTVSAPLALSLCGEHL